MTISRNQLWPSQAKQANKKYLFKEYWVLVEDSLGGLESVLKADFELTRKPQDCFYEDISELWLHKILSARLLGAVSGTVETQGLWPLPSSSSNGFALMNQSPYVF